MAKICPNCGAEAPDQFRFCGFCAATLDVAVPEPASAEPASSDPAGRSARRLVTMLFADLTNYTHAASRIDPEEMFLAIRRTLEQLAQPVQRLGGRIDRYVGDGFLATFGIPEAHEDDPIRAVQTALEMQHAMHSLRREVQQSLGWDVQLRVGVNLGPVISGQLDTGTLPDPSVFGHAVNVAHRLQNAARPGTVLVSEAVYRLTRSHFEYRDPLNLHLKGLDAAVIAYEVIGQRSAPLPSRGLSGRSTPLVGRAAESAALLGALQRLKVERQGMIAVITGEPGIGKTRLVEEVLAPLSNHFTIVRAAASPTELTSYGLLTRLIEDLAGIGPDDNRATRQQRLEDWLAPASTLAHDLGPVLQNLVSGQTSREGLIGNPQQDQRRIYAAIRRLIAWQARRRAILLVVDDLHWADPSSLAVLAHAADLVREAPLGLIGLARPGEIEHLPEPFALRPETDPAEAELHLHLPLKPLTPAESDQLLNLLLPEVPAPPELLSRIVARTSGNPLLMEEVVRMLLDQGVIRQAGEGWEVSPQWVEAVQKVPETLNGLILGRYDRLPTPLKATLDAAAVLGSTFSLPLLLGITGQAEPELRRELTTLEQIDFLRRAPGTGLPVYVFRHWLLQEAIYQTILQKERRTLHLRAAQVIQQMAESLALDMAARVGYHLERGQSRQAIGYLMQAARRAADRFANAEAIEYYQRTQALLDQHGARQEEAVDVALGLTALLARTNQVEAARETLEKARSLSVGPPNPGYRLADVLYQFGQLKSRAGQHAEARAAFEAAAANLRDSRADGASGSHTIGLSDIEREIGWLMFDQGQLSEARARGEVALRLALQDGDLQAAAGAHNLLGGAHWAAGQLADSVSSQLRALAIREQLGDVWGSAGAQTNLGGLYFKLGQWAQAESFLRQAIFVQQEIGDYRSMGSSWSTLGLLLLDSGRYEEALHAQNQALSALRGRDEPYSMAVRYLSRGTVWLRLGVATWATADIERGLNAANQINNGDLRATALALLAEARLIESDLDNARQHLLQAEGLSEISGSLETRAEVLRVRAQLRQAERDWDRALEANQQAQDLFRQIGNRYEVARRQVEAAELMLARASAGVGRQPNGSASQSVREALDTFRSLHAQADIPRAENLISRLSSGLGPGSLGEQMVVVVHLHMELPELAGETEARQEELASLFGRISTALEKVGRERGATVATSGPGLVYLFTSPTLELTESLAQQAVQGAQDAIDTAARLNRASRRANSLEIAVSLGITAGHWPAASTDPQEAAIFGNVSQPGRQAQAAARLAGPNSIALSGDLTQVLRNTYELEMIPAPAEQRSDGPVFRLGRVRPQTQLAQPLPGSSPRLIGRQAELAALTGWIDRLMAERAGRVCYLEAEAGMGKTRLLDQLLEYARPGALCLIGKCESFRAGMSYWPLLNILEQADLPETALVHQLQSLLALRAPDEADAHLLRNLPPTGLRQEIFARVRAMLLEAAAERPVLVVIEDIHWLDLSSLELIDYLLPLTLEAPIAIMLVARAEMPGPHRGLIRKAEKLAQSRYLPVAFTGLSLPETQALVQALLGGAETLPDGLWPLLQPFSGHPLSMEEALRFLVESGWLWAAGERWQLAYARDAAGGATAAGADRRMPPTFKDLLLRRLDLLPSETLHVLQAAAVLGESFDHTVLSHVVGGPAVARRLSELVDRGWLLPAHPDNPLLFRFKHTLTRETIYATLLNAKRRVLHQRAGEALESLYPEAQAENVEVLAYHFGQSSLREKALGYLVRAAQSALTRHALSESLQYYQQARDIVATLPEPQTRLAATIALGLADVHLALGDPNNTVNDLLPQLEVPVGELPAEVRAGLWRRLGAARRRIGEFGEALENYQIAREVLLGQPELAAAPGGRSTSETAASVSGPASEAAEREARIIELGLAQTLFDMRENQRARAQAEHALREIDRRRFPELAAETLNLLGGMAYRESEGERAYELVRDSLAIYQAYGNRGGAAAAYANLGVLAAVRQDVETAYNNFALSLGLREALGDSAGIAAIRTNLGQLERNRGRFGEAIQHLTVAAEKARHAELNPLLAQTLGNLGQALTLSGQRGQALAVLDDAELLCQNHGLKNTLCEVLWKRAECQLENDDLTAAQRSAEASLALANDLSSADLRSEARRVLSRLYRRSGQTAAALDHAGAAWVARAKDPSPVMRARFAAEYALAQAAAGQTADARRLLDDHVNPVQLPESAAMLREVAEAMAEM